MIVAFDFHGSLGSLPTLRRLCREMAHGGHQCHLISALGMDDPNEAKYRELIPSWGIAFAGIHFVRFSGTPTPDVAYKVGLLKVDVMKRIDATILFDDNPHICRAVKDSGLLACRLYGNEGT